uniref:DUF4836 domain-containing protein n=1 Tax=uncultured Muribaculaceae bacterium TaxID=2301481 RepID=A0A6G8F3P4_9BACT|nr:hypothetical protein Muribac1_0550 [uncultured Muribaculaceae bacterium]
MLIALLPALNSCKKETVDVSQLLATVPSSAGAVVGFNLTSLLEKAGCKVDGSEITPGADLGKWIDGKSELNGSQKEALRMFLSGESGIDPAGAILFTDAYSFYVTAGVADTPKFMDFVKKQTGSDFEEPESGVKTCGNVALCGAQMWISLSSGSIDAKAVKNYSELDEAQSMLSHDLSKEIASMADDIVGWGQIKSFLRKLDIQDQAVIGVVSGMLFEDASVLSFRFNFLPGQMIGKTVVLNDKGKPAKYLLPADKIDTALVENLSQQAGVVAAMSVTKDLVKKIEKLSSSFGGNMFGPVMSALGSLDGTVALTLTEFGTFDDGVSGAVTTDGNPSRILMQFLSAFGPTKKEGNVVRVAKGEVMGSLNVAEVSEFLKGSTFGFVIAPTDTMGHSTSGIAGVGVSLVPEKGGITLNIDVKGADPKENIILTFLKSK